MPLRAYRARRTISSATDKLERSAIEFVTVSVGHTHSTSPRTQVGTNDALARVPVANFATTLDGTLRWLAERRVDTVIVDPQYTSRLGTNDVYTEFIDIIEEVARRNRVPLVRRFEAMQYLAQVREGAERMYLAGDHFHLNDLGYRCMAEQAARAITLSLLQSE